jgi:hypothetical protein
LRRREILRLCEILRLGVSLIIRRRFGCGVLGFAQRSLLVLLSLFLFAPCAGCPLSFGSISSVIWLECHWNPLDTAG